MSTIRSVLIVDLPNVFWSVALGGNLANSNAARDIVLRELRGRADGYDRVAVAVDGPGKSFRSALWDPIAADEPQTYKVYKAGRSERPEHLWTLLAETARHCASDGWHVFDSPPCDEHPGTFFEGDDVIATLANYCVCELAARVDILSGDSDLCQLVDDEAGVRLFRRYKGYKVLDCDGVNDWKGVYPNGIVELKALAGDDSDKYKPFPGVGDDTALKMLAKAGWSAAVALQQIADTPKRGVVQERMSALGPERLTLAYQLARLRRDVPLDCMRLQEKRERVAPAEFAADLVPEEVEGERVEAAPVGRPSVAMVAADPTARMLVSPAEVRQRLLEFQALVKIVLVPQVDFGLIPGCGNKPVLFKSGAEKLGEVYGYAPYFELQQVVEDWEKPFFFYRVKGVLRKKIDGSHVAELIGSANSRETKWAARWVWEREIPGHLQRESLRTREITISKGQRAGEKALLYQVPNEAIFDQCNTILKVAEKRAYVGAILIACRASGVFAADVEDTRPDPDAMGSVSDRPQWGQS